MMEGPNSMDDNDGNDGDERKNSTGYRDECVHCY